MTITSSTYGRKDYRLALSLQDISKTYGGQIVVDKIALQVAGGEIFGLLGPNGAGKTTLMKIIAGLTLPTAGKLALYGRDGLRDRQAVKPLIGLVPQESNMEKELTVREALFVYARLFGLENPGERVRQVTEEFNLATMITKKVGVLSGGMTRRVLIARALLPSPRLLLLDEPTVGLDPDVRWDIWQVVRQLAAEGKTIFMTTHYMEEAEQLCRRVALLKEGRILLVDTPEKIKLSVGLLDGQICTLEKAFLHLVRGGSA